jgi:tetratricopeptide (TPR) repeat protein
MPMAAPCSRPPDAPAGARRLWLARRLLHLLAVTLVLASVRLVGALAWYELARMVALLAGLVLLVWLRRRELKHGDRAVTSVMAAAAALLLVHLSVDLSVNPQGPFASARGYGALLSILLVAAMVMVFVLSPLRRRLRRLAAAEWAVMLVGGLGLVVVAPGSTEADWRVVWLAAQLCLWVSVFVSYGDTTWRRGDGCGGGTGVDRWWSLVAGLAVLVAAAAVAASVQGITAVRRARAGDEWAQQGRWEQALEVYTSACAHSDVLGWEGLASRSRLGLLKAHLNVGADQESARVAAELVSHGPGPALRRQIGETYMAAGRGRQAVPYFESLLREGVGDSTVVDSLLAAYLRSDQLARFHRAAQTYGRAPELDGLTLRQLIGLGTAMGEIGRLRASAAVFQRGLEEHPGTAYLSFRAGCCWLELNNPAGSLSYARDALAADSTFAQAHMLASRCLAAMGRSQEARQAAASGQMLEPLLRSVPEHPELRAANRSPNVP